MPRFQDRILFLLVPAAFLILSLAPGVWPDYSWAIRVGGVISWILSLPILDRTQPIGPAWILSTIVLFIYCIFPEAIEISTIYRYDLSLLEIDWKTLVGLYDFNFYNSSADLWVWRLILALSATTMLQTTALDFIPNQHHGYKGGTPFRVILTVLSVFAIAIRVWHPGNISTWHDLILPIAIFTFGYSLLGLLRGEETSAVDMIAATVFLLLCANVTDGKPLFFYALGISTVILRYIKIKRAAVILSAITILSASAIITIHKHTDHPPDAPQSTSFMEKISSKSFTRQYVTLRCYNGALTKKTEDDGILSGPLFFGASLIPRALWPNKPSFSQGKDYTALYCGDNCCVSMVASITTLGEPWIHGGAPMTAAAIAIICLLLLATGIAMLRAPLPFAAMAMALNPWVLDFDLHFSLWIALAVKGIGLMLPMAAWLYWREKRPARPITPQG